MARYELRDPVDVPFPLGGCFGVWGYGLRGFIEPRLGGGEGSDLGLPDLDVGFYDDLVVFEGNAPADVRENAPLRRLLDQAPAAPVRPARVWLGAPNSIKGPTEVAFQRQRQEDWGGWAVAGAGGA